MESTFTFGFRKIFYYSLLVILATIFLIACKESSQELKTQVYLCFGQSNMEGSGIIESIDSSGIDRFVKLQSLDCPEQNLVKGNWYPALPPLCQCYSGLSLADYFGRAMIVSLPSDVSVGVVNVAVGGCDIRLFDKDVYEDYYSTHPEEWFAKKISDYGGSPYNHLLDLARIAQKDGVIKGILLHQGETNTGNVNWPQYVKKIYNDLLNDLDLEATAVPLLVGELVSQPGNCCSSMNPIINTLPSVIHTAHIISSEDCTASDQAHFDSAGYRELGRRYAEMMLSLL